MSTLVYAERDPDADLAVALTRFLATKGVPLRHTRSNSARVNWTGCSALPRETPVMVKVRGPETSGPGIDHLAGAVGEVVEVDSTGVWATFPGQPAPDAGHGEAWGFYWGEMEAVAE